MLGQMRMEMRDGGPYAQEQMEQMQIQQQYFDQQQGYGLGGHSREGYSAAAYPPSPPRNSYDVRHGYAHLPAPQHREEDERYQYERERDDRSYTNYPPNFSLRSYPPPHPSRSSTTSSHRPHYRDEDENGDEDADDGGMHRRQRHHHHHHHSYYENERQSRRSYEHSYPTPVPAGNGGRGRSVKQEPSEENNTIRAAHDDEHDDEDEDEVNEIDQLVSSFSEEDEEDRDDDDEYRASYSYYLPPQTQDHTTKSHLTVPDSITHNNHNNGITRTLSERSARRVHPYANPRSPSASPSLSPATPSSSSSTSSPIVVGHDSHSPTSSVPSITTTSTASNAPVNANLKLKYISSIQRHDSQVMSRVSTALRPAQGFTVRSDW